MDGASKRERRQLLRAAEAARAAQLDQGDYRAWVAEVQGVDRRLPATALATALPKASAHVAKISMAEALRRMH